MGDYSHSHAGPLSLTLELLKDEAEGIERYEHIIETCEEQELKQLLSRIVAEEKLHVKTLLSYANKHLSK